MRTELFNAIKESLERDVPEIKHIDMWNHNVEFIEQEASWERPAVFIEFAATRWSAVKGLTNRYRGDGMLRVHVVTDWVDGGASSAFALTEKVHWAIDGMDGERYDTVRLLETHTNHNHEEILENIDVYAFKCIREQ